MKDFASLLFLVLVAGCSKQRSDCTFPTFMCLQGKWIEKEHTAGSIQLKEYIQVYVENNREILYDGTVYAQLQMTQEPIGKYYFEELAHQDSVALTDVWQEQIFHWTMVMQTKITISGHLKNSPTSHQRIT